jgi:hypothetical protein
LGGLYPELDKGAFYYVRGVTEPFIAVDGVGLSGKSKVRGFWNPARFELAQEPSAATARSNDPATSKGKRKTNKYEQAVLGILKGLYQGQGYTGKQIASLTGHPLNCITPRFAPLRRKGLIKDSGERRDKQIVWVLA